MKRHHLTVGPVMQFMPDSARGARMNCLEQFITMRAERVSAPQGGARPGMGRVMNCLEQCPEQVETFP